VAARVSQPIRINLYSVLSKIRHRRTVAQEFQICLYDPTDVYWELFGNSWSEGFLENSCNNGLLGQQSGQPPVWQFIGKKTACRQIRGGGSTNGLASSVWSLGTQRWGRKHNLSCKLHDAATCTQARLGAVASRPPGSSDESPRQRRRRTASISTRVSWPASRLVRSVSYASRCIALAQAIAFALYLASRAAAANRSTPFVPCRCSPFLLRLLPLAPAT